MSFHVFVADFDFIEGEGVVRVEFLFDFGLEGDVEDEGEVILFLNVLRFLLFVSEGLSEDVDFVLFDIVEQSVLKDFVHFLCFGLCAIHFLDEADGHFAGAEAGHLCFLAVFFQFVAHFGFIVSLFQLDCDFTGDGFFVLFELDVHCEYGLFLFIVISKASANLAYIFETKLFCLIFCQVACGKKKEASEKLASDVDFL